MKDLKISKAQQRILNTIKENKGVKFIMWGLNYYQMWDKENNYLSRCRHCVYDALKRKQLIYSINGIYLISNN